jgi:CBS domain-containing protein
MTVAADLLSTKGNNVVSVLPTDSVAVAAQRLSDKSIGVVVVREKDGRMAGILSERDIIRAIALSGQAALKGKVEDLMTKDVNTCKPTTTLQEIMKLMTARRHRHAPICDDNGDLVGIVSITDVVKKLFDDYAQEKTVLRQLNLAKV